MRRLTTLMLAVIAAVMIGNPAFGAKNIEDLRIYINPGHGAWGSNDRPWPVIYEKPDGTIGVHDPGCSTPVNQYPDTLGFYESNTNLWKCLAVVDYLEAAGMRFDRTLNQNNTTQGSEGPGRDLRNNIVMSRTKNGPYPCTANTNAAGGTGSQYNRSLTEICAEVNSNHFDFFVAIHSNGGTDGTNANYLLFEYRGYNDVNTTATGLTKTHQKKSREMAELMAKYTHYLPYQKWSNSTSPWIYGDITFNTWDATIGNGALGCLGALKHLVPGVLTEGYFHTYQPSRHRAMNPDVDRIEGLLYIRGIFEYFGIPFSGKGNIYGIVRAQGQTFSHTYYTPNTSTNDKYRPINNAHIDLYQNGVKLRSYTTDTYFNGAFVFFDLDPGTYYIEVSASGYRTFGQEVVVKADQESLPEVFLVSESSGVSGGDGTLYNPAASAGIMAPTTYALTREYTDQVISDLATCTSIRRVVAYGNYLYILGFMSDDTPVLVKYDHVNRTSTLLSTSGCTGTYLALSDIAMTTDGYLVGINCAQQDSSSDYGTHTSAETYIYKWANGPDGTPTTAAPTRWLSSASSGLFYKAKTGLSMAYAGSTNSGYIYYTAHNDYYTTSNTARIVRLTIRNNAVSATMTDRLSDLTGYTTDAFGDMRLDVSPTSGHYLLGGTLHATVDMAFPTTTNSAPTLVLTMGSAVPAAVKQPGVLAYANKTYVVTPAEGSTSGKTDGIDLVDITSGLASASKVTTTNNRSTTASSTYDLATAVGAGTTMVNVQGEQMTFTMALFELRGINRLTKLTAPSVTSTRTIDTGSTVVPGEPIGHGRQAAKRAPMAYGLTLDGNQSAGFTATFSLSEDADRAEVLADDVVIASLNNPKQGANSVALDLSALTPGETYNWSVRVTGQAGIGGKAYQHNHPDHRTNVASTVTLLDGGGVAVINDPEAEHFGWSGYSNNYGNGLMFFNPELEPTRKQPWPYNYAQDCANYYKVALTSAEAASVEKYKFKHFRMATDGDDFYVCDFNDPGSNIWRITSATYTKATSPAPFTSIYPSGASIDSSNLGYWYYNGSQVGSGTSSFGFTGTGADRKLWMYAEDFSPANTVIYFPIGASMTNTATARIPNSTVKKGGLSNKNSINMSPWGDGMWLALNTTNEEGKPAFIYMLSDGTIKYNSYTSSEQLNNLTATECSIAINPSGSMLAIGVPEEGIRIYNVTWSGTTPTLSYFMTVAESDNYDSTPNAMAMTASAYAGVQLAWDWANNVYAWQISPAAENAGLNVYSLGIDHPVVTTPAPQASVITVPSTPLSGTVAAPIFKVNGVVMTGAEYSAQQELTLTLSTDTSGASIYYSYLDGDNYDDDVLYTGPITISRSCWIEAYATKSGMYSSDTIEKTFYLTAPTPTITPSSAVDLAAMPIVTISAPAGFTIRYTTDGTEPSASNGTLYDGPFTPSGASSITVKAIAVRDGWTSSAVVSKTYTVEPAQMGAYAYDLRLTTVTSSHQSAMRRAREITRSQSEITGYILSYKLTENVLDARIKIIDRADDSVFKIITEDVGIRKGENQVYVDNIDFEPGHIYLWRLELTPKEVEATACLGRIIPATKANACGGVAMMRDLDSPYYGYFAVSEGFGSGVRLMAPGFIDLGYTKQSIGSHWDSDYRYSPYRVYAGDGNFYISDWSDKGADVYRWELATPNHVFSAVFKAAEFTPANGRYTATNGDVWAGSNTSFAFTGTGVNRKLWAFMEDVPYTYNGTTNREGVLCRYDMPEGSNINAKPVIVNTELSGKGLFPNLDVEMAAAHGGLFMSQKKAIAAAHPALVYVTTDGTVLFNSNTDLPALNTCGRGIAVNDDASMIAVSRFDGSIDVYNIVWAANGKPNLTLRTTLSNDVTCDEISQMTFDAGGNLYAWYRTSDVNTCGLYAFAIGGQGPNIVLSAPSYERMQYIDPDAEPEGTDRYGVYAYDLTYSGGRSSGYTLDFKLNGPAKRVEVRLLNIYTGRYLDETIGKKWEMAGNYGDNTLFIDPVYLENEAAYLWEVNVYNLPVAQSDLLINKDPIVQDAAGGVLVIKDHNSPAYGHIVTVTGKAAGFNTYTPAYYETTPYLAPDSYVYAKHPDWTASNRYSPSRIAEIDGMVVATSWSDDGSGLYTFQPLTNEPIGTMYPLGASRDSNGLWTYGSTKLGGSVTGIAFTGSGDDTKMWTYEEDFTSVQSVVRYDLGTSRVIESSPTIVNGEYLTRTGLLQNNDVCLTPTSHGLFVSQVRATGENKPDVPAFVFVDFDGNVLYNAGESLHGELTTPNTQLHLKACGSAVAVNDDETLLAVSEGYHGIKVFDLDWDVNGAPVLSNMRLLAFSGQNFDATAIRMPQMCFDPAGNLLAFYFNSLQYQNANTHAGIHVYAINRDGPTGASAAPRRAPGSYVVDPNEYLVKTKAPDSQVLRGNDCVTDDPEIVRDAEANAVYYNLQGIRIDAEQLRPGVYIRVRGNVTDKVLKR